MKPGDRVKWLHVPRGGYGYCFPVPATIVRVGKRRITIDALLKDGTTKRVAVKECSLKLQETTDETR